MSGGVDSSVTVALLKKRGYDVIGITMQLLPQDLEKQSACCNLGSTNDAKRVASRLGVPHYTINSRAPFQEKVIDYFVSGYLSGYTPNPCVECNRHIKFEELKSRAREFDADYVATGHYVRRTKGKNRFYLKKAKDASKDQSYFLYMLQSEQLKSILFPLGGYLKSEIREIANGLGLVNANKPDSQEICFVSQKSYREFIKERLKDDVPAGDIVDTTGKKLGSHTGIFQYTIGQRRGLNLSSPEPLFVLKIDKNTNTVVVGKQDELKSQSVKLHTFTQVNDEPIVGKTFSIKMRYQMTPYQGRVISLEDGRAVVDLKNGQSFVTPGQSCVIYDKDRVIGGGIIEL